MAQRIRKAGPGTWHHVYNRGIDKRVIFATRADYVHFKSLMACSVRRGEIEIHAFCLLGTHFHLLVRIPQGGDLSKAMGRIQNAYARWFNRRSRRSFPRSTHRSDATVIRYGLDICVNSLAAESATTHASVPDESVPCPWLPADRLPSPQDGRPGGGFACGSKGVARRPGRPAGSLIA